MLATLVALGVGPASFLGRRFDPAARLAMSPALGLCLGTGAFTTLIWFTAASNTYWLLPILALTSLAVAVRRRMGVELKDRGADRPSARRMLPLVHLRPFDALALAMVCVVVAAPLSYTLRERHSVGPIGFEVWDAVGYTAEIDGMTQQSIRQAAHGNKVQAGRNAVEVLEKAHQTEPRKDFIQRYWEFYAPGNQNLDAAPLSANLNELVGLHATDTQTLFLIAFLISGALGAFAAVRYAAPRPAWVAPFAGILFAGPFFMQLVADGSQAAVCGLGVILPLVAMGTDALCERRLATLVLFALLASGLMALYPLFVSGVALSAAVVLLAMGALAWWRGRLTRVTLARAFGQLGIVLALIIAFDVVSFTRDVGYWHDVLAGDYFLAGLPQYHLPYSVLPGWLLQTREFYFLTDLGSASVTQILIGVVLAALFLGVILFGLFRRRASLILVPLVLIFLLLAEYTSAAHHCAYCTDRALLPVAPAGIWLLALGIAALATSGRSWLRWTGVAIAIMALIAVAERTRQERLRFADGAYFLDAGDRALLSRLPHRPGPVDLEGYGEVLGKAPGELPLVYFMTWERNHKEVSVPSEYVDNASLAYLGEANPANPQFIPGYRYVLTRFAGVQTGRRVIARTGSLALEERSGPLDATVVSGLGLPLVRLDDQGLAWVEGPLHVIVTGGDSIPAWIALRFRYIVPVSVPRQPDVHARLLPGGILAACVRARGTGPIRRGTIRLAFSPLPGIIPNEPFALSEPPQGVQLTAIRAVSHCSLPQ